jgi:hypothetical protein
MMTMVNSILKFLQRYLFVKISTERVESGVSLVWRLLGLSALETDNISVTPHFNF